MSVGDWVEIPSDQRRGNPRQGRIIAVYEHYVIVRFKHYQEAFRFFDVKPIE